MNFIRMVANRISNEPILPILFICSLISILFLLLMFLFILYEGSRAFSSLGLELFFGTTWEPGSNQYGALPLIYGSIVVVIIALLISIPLGISTSIFVAEIVHSRVKDIIKSLIELLSSIPSVIYGFIGLVFLAPIISSIFSIPSGTVALTAGIILSIMILPTIVGLSSEIIASVPKEFREASIALGATKWQTIRYVVIPYAKSGIVASILLAFSRAIGETIAVVMVAGNTAIIPSPPWNILSPVYTLTGAIAIQMGEASIGDLEYSALFGLGFILLLITFIVNTLADILLKEWKKRGL